MNVDGWSQRVRATCGDRDGVILEDPIMLNWANDGQKDIAKRIKCLVGTATISTISNQAEYPVPIDIFEPISVTESTSGIELRPVGYRALSRNDASWKMASGTPYLYYTKGNKLGLYPKPAGTISNAYSLEYFRLPVLLVDPSDGLEIPEFSHNTLVEYGIWKAKELLEDFDGANYYKESYIGLLITNIEEASLESTYPMIQDTDTLYSWSFE